MPSTTLDGTHVQHLLDALLAHGYGELTIRIHDHAIVSLVPMPIVKHVTQVDGIYLGLTVSGTRANVSP
jgi:hypothetical protein